MCARCLFALRNLSLALLPLVLLVSSAQAQGIALTGVGPINRAMGGASTAAPIDAAGALHWNPASISGLPTSEVTFSMELLLAQTELSSSIPSAGLAGATDGESGIAPIPAVSLVHKPCDSRWTFGLGMYGIAGFRTNYPARPDFSNPILSSPEDGLGIGSIYSEAEVLQIAPTVSYALTDRLSIGIAPTVSLARVAIDPLLLSSPDPESQQYFSGRGTRWAWGGGVQAGVYYIGPHGFNLGASVKSPQWFEDFRFNTEDGETAKVDIDYPMIISVGGSYTGCDRLLLACDVRFFDYANTPGLGNSGYGPDGAARGLNWKSIMSVHTGVQYEVTQCLHVRMGYVFQQNPIRSDDVTFNVASPLIIGHIASVGASYQLSRSLVANVAYIRGFQSELDGPYLSPELGDVGRVGTTVSADALTFGFTVRY